MSCASRRFIRRGALALGLASAALAPACKLDSILFSGKRVSVYALPATVIPDSLRAEVTFVSGGETLHAYWIRQPGPAPRVVMLFSHGKGANLARATEWRHAEMLWQAGFDVLTYDYRGFGRSTGTSVDETTLAADAQAALAFVLAQPGASLGRVVSYGHSLGSAPAIALAAANLGIRALVIEAGFSNGQAMVESADPLGFPVQWLMRQPMRNTVRIAIVSAPVLILHGEIDAQIPVAQARDLHAAARDPKQLRIVAGAAHEDVQLVLGLVEFSALVRTHVNAGVP